MFTMGSQQESEQAWQGRRYWCGDLRRLLAPAVAAAILTTVIGGTIGKLSLRWQKIWKRSKRGREPFATGGVPRIVIPLVAKGSRPLQVRRLSGIGGQ
jgi:hypothetical protein